MENQQKPKKLHQTVIYFSELIPDSRLKTNFRQDFIQIKNKRAKENIRFLSNL
jgi:hypothetical protein